MFEYFNAIIFIIIVVGILMLFALAVREIPATISEIRGWRETKTGGGEFMVRERGSGDITIVLIPGLGNGLESFNWNLSTPEQQAAVGVDAAGGSLQDKLAEKYRTISFDPPGYESNIDVNIGSIDDYVGMIHDVVGDGRAIVVGHSIGARVAQYYADKYGGNALMIDPTPDYVLKEMSYRKHLDNPGVKKYEKTAAFIATMQSAELARLSWRDSTVIYTIDSADPGRERKSAYFDGIDARQKIREENAGHWVHLTRAGKIIGLIDDIARR